MPASLFDANCFTLPLGCALVPQRQEAACNAFCGVSSAAGAAAAAACGGHGVCYPEGASLAPTCLCDAGFVQFGGITCVAQGQNKKLLKQSSGSPTSIYTHQGGQRETKGNFTAEPVKLFCVRGKPGTVAVWAAARLSRQLYLLPLASICHVGFNGLAFVISARTRWGVALGWGYGGMDTRSMAVEFDTLQNKEHGDMSSHHVGLNAYTAWVDYEPGDPGTLQVFLADSQEKPQQAVLEWRLALCEVLQGAAFLLLPEQSHVIQTFKYQDPGCYTGRLNHVVLVIGYFILRNDGSQNRIAPPFWIIRNSWGVEWGDRGHMRMDIQEGMACVASTCCLASTPLSRGVGAG
ncbi:unnamed protein product [Closterium sp. NIES-64]|nr:unnamed protein product [Closterium sp. NIES-64]